MRNSLPLCFACFTAAVIAAPVQAQYLFVDVDAEQANSIIAKLNRAQIKGHKVKVKIA